MMTLPLTSIKSFEKQEAWRYNRLSRLLQEDWQPVAGNKKPAFALPQALVKFDGLNDEYEMLTIYNGALEDQASCPDVKFTPSSDPKNVVTMLRDNFAKNGANIVIDAKTSRNLALNFVHEGQGDSIAYALPFKIHVKAGARLNLIETWQNANIAKPIWAMPDFNIMLEEGARLDWMAFSHQPAHHYITTRHHVTMQAKAQFNHLSYHDDVGFFRSDFDIHLCEAQAKVSVHGAYKAMQEAQITHAMNIHHHAKDCQSSQLFHGVVDDAAIANFQGNIVVAKGADQTDAIQKHQGLLLSNKAVINAKPALEIYADDVACAHGAGVRDLDPMQLFYMRSRGMDMHMARELLIAGFLTESLRQSAIYEDHAAFIQARLN